MELVAAKSLFQSATGFIRRGGFDFTCNPYVGCTFGCVYCYAMFLPQNRRPKEEWGRWLKAKANAVALANKFGPKLRDRSLYLSSVTDPYLPIENTLRLTRGILEALLPYQPRLLVQTRGPLVTRDIDLLRQFRHLRVNLSIPTDSEEVWRVFEPKSPKLEARWQAAEQLREQGISVGLCLTPLLPLAEEAAFARRVVDFQPEVLVIQDFHDARGGFGADTGPLARRLLEERRWSIQNYTRFRGILQELGQPFYEGEQGFFPPGPAAC